jgi:hypothetical protein
LTEVHAAIGVALIAANAAAGAWGGVTWLRRSPSVVFWYLLRVAQALVVLQALLGLVLLAQRRAAPDDLHFVYGIAPLVIALVSETMRVGAVQRELEDVDDLDALDRSEQAAVARRMVLREMGIMTVGTLLIVTLALRAAFSG